MPIADIPHHCILNAKSFLSCSSVGETVVITGSSSPIKNILTSVDVLGGDVAQRENVDSAFALFARLRRALDPTGTLNPNVLPR